MNVDTQEAPTMLAAAAMARLYQCYFHVVVYRRYDRTRPNAEAHPITGQGIHGPAYEYTDQAVKVWRQPRNLSRAQTQVETPAVAVPVKDFIYYFNRSFIPREGDVIIELRDKSQPLSPDNYADAFRIAVVLPFTLDNDIIYYTAHTQSIGAQHVGDPQQG